MTLSRSAATAFGLALLGGGAVVSLAPGCMPPGELGPRKAPARVTAARPPSDEPVRCLFDAEDLKKQKVGAGAGGAFAVTPGAGGELLLAGADNIYGLRSWKPVADQALKAPLSFAAGADGTVYVVTGREFGVLAGGVFRKVTQLPAEGFSVSAATDGGGGGGGGGVLLHGPAPNGMTVVYLMTNPGAKGATLQRLLIVEGRVDALAAFGPDFVFALGGRLFQAGTVRDGKTAAVLIAALGPEERVVSLAADERRRTVFVATGTETLMLRGKALVPILAFGGELALGGERLEKLYVYQASEGRAFEVNLQKHLANLAKQVSAGGN